MGDAIARLAEGSLTTYKAKEDFLRDPESGVVQEIGFWRSFEDDLS